MKPKCLNSCVPLNVTLMAADGRRDFGQPNTLIGLYAFHNKAQTAANVLNPAMIKTNWQFGDHEHTSH